MSKFHLENWREYYNAELDEDDLKSQIEEFEEGQKVKANLSDDKLVTEVTNTLDGYIIMVGYINDETGEEDEIEIEVSGDLVYTAEYKLEDIESNLDDIEESLRDAIESGQSTFEVLAPAKVVSVSDVSIDQVECFDLEDYDERKIYDLALKEISNSLVTVTSQAHAGDFIQPPEDKNLTFICTIPSE